MKILLINPPFQYSSPHLPIGTPLSLAYLAAYARQQGRAVEIFDAAAAPPSRVGRLWHYGYSDRIILERIKNASPDLVGITCPFSLTSAGAAGVAKLVKSVDRRIVTVLGGIHPTIFPAETVADDNVDYVIVGEGEESFLQLVQGIESGALSPGSMVDGCAFKDAEDPRLIQKKHFIGDLDALPFPARDLLPMEFYFSRRVVIYGVGGRRATSIITSRSCPKRCTFCSMYLMHGPRWRGRSVENVFEEIRLLVEKYGVKELFFMDDNMTYDRDRMLRLCDMILRAGLAIRWNTPNGVMAEGLDYELALMMKKAGCANICIGIEAGNDRMRNVVVRKRLSAEKINDVVHACAKARLPVLGFFILGLPGETEETFRDTIQMVRSLPLSMITTSFFIPLPGTELYEECIRKGYVTRDFWRGIEVYNTPVMETDTFSLNTLRRWEKRIYLEFIKSHFRSVLFRILTLRNDLFRFGQVTRFLMGKCLAPFIAAKRQRS